MEKRSAWGSKIGFILASAGSAIGLGAMWKFPYVMADNGGAAFLVLFMIFTLFIGLPLLLAEFVIGRHGKTYSTDVFGKITGNKYYNLIGHLGNIGVFLLLSFYSVIGGWILLYMIRTIVVIFTGQHTDNYEALFGELISQPLYAIFGALLFILLTAVIVSKGIQDGIERASKVMMPLLFVAFLIIIIRSLTLPNAMAGVMYFLKPDFTVMNTEGVLFALGQSFFSLSVGFGGMLTYASYLDKKTDIVQSGFSVVGLNILVTLLAGLAIFPATASLGIENAQGPGLLFIVLPYVFDQLPLGSIFYFIFLSLFFFATITSSISLIEINVSNAIKNNERKRKKAVCIISVLLFILSIPSALSNGLLSEVKFGAGTFFDNMDYLVSNILLPIGALCFALFTGYRLNQAIAKEELKDNKYRGLFSVWSFLLRYIIPVVIIAVFISLLIK
ncbi:sodium-dependent transporter [Macrococcoides caseolyticum]|uniref:sodium-dependent transporter n=1 Tax=Macrococcoides caseolyticum TaxID=69966 RepID=UPI001F23FEBC|nr:sodium-dependent transporter [Macrococcus caseolyticus]MCE4956546.1 sodium-dependent transporter [Macrococcus caseolyticus]